MPIDLSGGFMPLCGKSSGTWMEDVNGERRGGYTPVVYKTGIIILLM
jgi:hypothetical protein